MCIRDRINTTLSDVVNTGASSSGSMVIVWLTSVELPHESTASQVRLWYPAHCSCTAVSVVTIDSMPTLSVNSGVSNTISSPHSTLLSAILLDIWGATSSIIVIFWMAVSRFSQPSVAMYILCMVRPQVESSTTTSST